MNSRPEHAADSPSSLSKEAAPGADERIGFALRALGVALLAAALTLCVFAPRFGLWRGLPIGQYLPYPETSRAAFGLRQLNDPWTTIDEPIVYAIQWRMLFPVVCHYLQLSNRLYLSLPHVGCLLCLWLVACLTQRQLGNWWATWVATMLFAALPWFFVSTSWLCYFDSWLVLALVAATFSRGRLIFGMACLLAPWIDERFVIALPVCILTRAAQMDDGPQVDGRRLAIDCVVAAAAILPYLLTRGIASLLGDAEVANYYELHSEQVRRVLWTRYPIGVWSGYRAAWFFFASAVYGAARKLGWRFACLWGFCVGATGLISLVIAGDMSRSMMVLSPGLLLGVWTWGRLGQATFRWVLPVVLAANLLIPATHEVWFFSAPIHWLPVELRIYRHPPDDIRPEHYTRIGMESFAQDNVGNALLAYDRAIQLDTGYLPAHLERASVYFATNEFARAEEDVQLVLSASPENPTALLLRARLRRQSGQIEAAKADVQLAIKHAPANSPLRRTAERFLAELNKNEP